MPSNTGSELLSVQTGAKKGQSTQFFEKASGVLGLCLKGRTERAHFLYFPD